MAKNHNFSNAYVLESLVYLVLHVMHSTDAIKTQARTLLIRDGYIWDWLAAGVIIAINFAVPTYLIPPRNRPYENDDPALSYPYQDDTVSNAVAAMLFFVPPAVIFLAGILLFKVPWIDGHHAYLSLIEAFSLASGWKRWMNLVGRLRPHWLAAVASGDVDKMKVGRLAYPSGHSAYTFVSATIITLWACGKLGVFSRPSQALYLKMLLCSSPLWLATFVACSRITDFKHDFSDVNAGSFIGIASAIVGYSLNFPSLFCPSSGQPKLREQDVARVGGNAYEAPAGDELGCDILADRGRPGGVTRPSTALMQRQQPHDVEEGVR